MSYFSPDATTVKINYCGPHFRCRSTRREATTGNTRRVRRLSARHLLLRTLTPSKLGDPLVQILFSKKGPRFKNNFCGPSSLFWPKNKVEPAAPWGLPPRCVSKVTQKMWTTPRPLFFFNTLEWVCFTYTWSTALSHCQEPKWDHYGSCHSPICGNA